MIIDNEAQDTIIWHLALLLYLFLGIGEATIAESLMGLGRMRDLLSLSFSTDSRRRLSSGSMTSRGQKLLFVLFRGVNRPIVRYSYRGTRLVGSDHLTLTLGEARLVLLIRLTVIEVILIVLLDIKWSLQMTTTCCNSLLF